MDIDIELHKFYSLIDRPQIDTWEKVWKCEIDEWYRPLNIKEVIENYFKAPPVCSDRESTLSEQLLICKNALPLLTDDIRYRYFKSAKERENKIVSELKQLSQQKSDFLSKYTFELNKREFLNDYFVRVVKGVPSNYKLYRREFSKASLEKAFKELRFEYRLWPKMNQDLRFIRKLIEVLGKSENETSENLEGTRNQRMPTKTALICIYNNKPITKNNCVEIARKYSKKPNAGKVLYKEYEMYAEMVKSGSIKTNGNQRTLKRILSILKDIRPEIEDKRTIDSHISVLEDKKL